MNGRFKGKTVIVTGGASGFGKAMVRSFAAEGASVLVADIDAAGAERVAAGIPSGTAFAIDVSNEQQTIELAKVAVDIWGRIDVFCANAGAAHRVNRLLDLSVEEFDWMFALNARSLYLAAKYCVRHMPAGSSIVATSSVGAIRPRPGFTAYGASKAAVIALVRGLALELAPATRVNAVLPVSAATAFDKAAFGGDGMSPAREQEIIRGIPMQRRAEPQDVANAAVFLASAEASFLTGVCLEVDGGRSI